MVLGVPEARVAEAIDVLGEGERVREGVGGRKAGGDGRLVENGEAELAGRRTHRDWMRGRQNGRGFGTFGRQERPMGQAIPDFSYLKTFKNRLADMAEAERAS